MAKKSFFNKFKDYVLDKDDEEESAEDIDRRLAKELAEIEEMEVAEVKGEKVIKDDYDAKDETAFIMNLGPLYQLIGGRQGILGKRLPDACQNIFERIVPRNEGSCRLRSDLFFMTFFDPSKEVGFRKAAHVTNEIGLQTIGDQFTSIELPNLLVAADGEDIVGEDGDVDLEKAMGQVESGGSGVTLGEPGPDDPVWLKLSVDKANAAAKVSGAKSGNDDAGNPDVPRQRRRGDPDWVEERTERRMRISSDPMQMERRSGGRDRRRNR